MLLLSFATAFLQRKSADVVSSVTIIQSTIGTLKAKRNQDTFDELFAEVSTFCQSRGIEVLSDYCVPDSGNGVKAVRATRHMPAPEAMSDFYIMSTLGGGSAGTETLTA